MTTTLSDSLAHAFFDRHPHAALVFDATGRVVHANPAAAWLGLDGVYPSFAQLTGLACPATANGQNALVPGWTRRLRVQAADGSSRQVDADLVAATSGIDKPLYCCILRDVTASVEAARGNQEVESRVRASTDSAPVLVWMSGTDMLCDWFNKWWLTFRGRTLGDELGNGWTEGVHPEDLERCLGIYSSSFEAREPYTMDFRMQRHDGVYRWVLSTGIPRYGQDGRFLGYIGTCLDITDRRELEDKLAERTRTLRLADRRREDFLAKLSHQLRNRLAPIANAAAILRNLEHGNRDLVVVREIIERQLNQLRRLVTELGDVTRITRGKVVLQREHVDIDAMLDSAIDQVRPRLERQHQSLRVMRAAAGSACEGDAQRLSQAVSALLDNAARFSPDGSTLRVSTRLADDAVAITVEDPGCGIDPGFLEHVFDLFVQGEHPPGRDDGGLGVGLTIARRVAEMHGGTLEIASAGRGTGAVASLAIPLRLPRGAASHDDFDPATLAGRRVLIIEANADSRDSLRLLLELGGNEVRTAAQADEGLRIAESFAPEYVVCDIDLPGGDGCELIPELRARLVGRPTRFVAVTGRDRTEDRDRALDSGFDSFLVKPLRPARQGAESAADDRR